MKILGYIAKNLYQLCNLAEAIIRVAAAIVEFTPSINDDKFVGGVKDWFDKIKGFLLKAGN